MDPTSRAGRRDRTGPTAVSRTLLVLQQQWSTHERVYLAFRQGCVQRRYNAFVLTIRIIEIDIYPKVESDELAAFAL